MTTEKRSSETRKGISKIWNTTTRKEKTLIIFGSIILLLVIIRLLLPFIVLQLVNDRLAKLKGYYGHVEDIDIALVRGAYQLNDMIIDKVDTVNNQRSPFFAASQVDLSVEWKALIKGSIVGEMVFEKPMITFTRHKVEPGSISKDSSSFRDLKEDLMPLRINRVETTAR